MQLPLPSQQHVHHQHTMVSNADPHGARCCAASCWLAWSLPVVRPPAGPRGENSVVLVTTSRRHLPAAFLHPLLLDKDPRFPRMRLPKPSLPREVNRSDCRLTLPAPVGMPVLELVLSSLEAPGSFLTPHPGKRSFVSLLPMFCNKGTDFATVCPDVWLAPQLTLHLLTSFPTFFSGATRK